MAKTIQVDGKKLSSLLKSKSVNMAKASRDCGMADSYLSNCIGYNYIAMAPAMLLEAKYGIMLDDYKYVEPKPQPKPEPAQPVEAAPVENIPQGAMTADDWNRISEMIISAAVDYEKIEKAVTNGFIEGMQTILMAEPATRQIQQMLYAAIRGALKRIQDDHKK